MKTVNWSTYEKTEKRRSGFFAAFLIIMLLCTIISRGFMPGKCPGYRIGKSRAAKHLHTVTADGKIEADKGKAVVVEAGIGIAEVCVTVGEKIQNNTVLLRLIRRI